MTQARVFTNFSINNNLFDIVRKGASTPHFKIIPHITRIPPFLKIPHPSTLPANRSSQVFLVNRDATVKLSSIKTIQVKQHHIGFFIFNFTLKYMLGNVYINKIHAGQCSYILYYVDVVGKVFSILSISLMYPKESFTSNLKQLG